MKKKTFTFTLEKSTKGTHRYKISDDNADEPVAAKLLYIQKDWIEPFFGKNKDEAPESLQITFEA